MSWTLPALRELAQHPRWVVWRYVVRDKGKPPTKPPYQLSGALASSTDPATWSPCTEAIRAHVGFDGCGFAIMGTEYCGVDLDHCLTFPPDADGRPVVAPWARAIVEALDSYTEVTPSGDSLRVWVKGTVPRGCQKTGLGPEKRGRLEIYSGVNRARYFTVTTNHFDGTPVTTNERQDGLTAVYRQHFGDDEHDDEHDHDHDHERARPNEDPANEDPGVLDADDRALIARAQTDLGERFARLWGGDRTSYGSASGADFALCAWLTFYTQDPVRLERLMRASRLVRTKWDTKRGPETWIGYTIRRQIEKDRKKPTPAPPRPPDGPRVASVRAKSAPDVLEPGSRPVIGVTRGDLGWAVTATWDAVKLVNDPPRLFRADVHPVRLDTDRDHGPVVRRLTLAMLRTFLAQAIDFERPTAEAPAAIDPPRDLVECMLTVIGDALPLPALEGVVEAPQILRSGEIVDQPGYSPAGRIYYAPSPALVVPPAPAAIDDRAVAEAVGLLDELLDGFPFAGDTDKTHAVGLMLSTIGRDVIPGQIPFHLVDAPVPGTGKGLLVDACCWPAVGRQLGRMTQSDNDEEMRKRLTAKLITRPAVVFLDNLSGRLDGEALSAILTTGIWEDRLLGGHELVRIPSRAIFVGTSNNLTASEEVARRLVTIRLDAKVERPELRPASAFTHPDLLRWAAEHRGPLVRALLTLWRAWALADRPRFTDVRMGSFEPWAEIVGGVLDHAGFKDFLAERSARTATLDPRLAAWRAFVEAWWAKFQDTPVYTKDLFALVQPPEGDGVDLDLGSGDPNTLKKRLGRRLQEMRDRYFGPYCIRLGNVNRTGREYFLVQSPI